MLARCVVVVGLAVTTMSCTLRDSPAACTSAPSTEGFVRRLSDVATTSTLVVRPNREVPAGHGCQAYLADVFVAAEATRYSLGLVSFWLLVSSVGDIDDARDVFRANLDRWEGYSTGPERSPRVRDVERRIRAVDGLKWAAVEGRCSLVDVSCCYVIGVGRWTFEIQTIYFGLVDQWDEDSARVDATLIDVARLLGSQFVGTASVFERLTMVSEGMHATSLGMSVASLMPSVIDVGLTLK